MKKGDFTFIYKLYSTSSLCPAISNVVPFWLRYCSYLLLLLYSAVWLLRILRTDQSVKFVTKYLSVLNEDGSLPQVSSSFDCQSSNICLILCFVCEKRAVCSSLLWRAVVLFVLCWLRVVLFVHYCWWVVLFVHHCWSVVRFLFFE